MKAIRVHQPGGPEAMKLDEVAVPTPGPGHALVKLTASGVNFIDIYFREGLYKAPESPIMLGMEGAGVVESVADDVTTVRPGERVAYAMARGSYAEYAVVPAWKLVPVPDRIDLTDAAAVMLQGMTAHYLTRSTYTLKPGETCLVHAAAGGTGLLITQIAKIVGARVFGTVSTAEKEAQARAAGADEIVRYTERDFVAEVKRMTDGNGVDVVYDSVGQTTFLKGLDCLRPRGLMVTFGQSSGAVPAFDPLLLNTKGALYVTRPSLGSYAATREEVMWRSGELFQWESEGKLKFRIDRVYPLADAARAHEDLAGRKTSGKLVLQIA